MDDAPPLISVRPHEFAHRLLKKAESVLFTSWKELELSDCRGSNTKGAVYRGVQFRVEIRSDSPDCVIDGDENSNVIVCEHELVPGVRLLFGHLSDIEEHKSMSVGVLNGQFAFDGFACDDSRNARIFDANYENFIRMDIFLEEPHWDSRYMNDYTSFNNNGSDISAFFKFTVSHDGEINVNLTPFATMYFPPVVVGIDTFAHHVLDAAENFFFESFDCDGKTHFGHRSEYGRVYTNVEFKFAIDEDDEDPTVGIGEIIPCVRINGPHFGYCDDRHISGSYDADCKARECIVVNDTLHRCFYHSRNVACGVSLPYRGEGDFLIVEILKECDDFHLENGVITPKIYTDLCNFDYSPYFLLEMRFTMDVDGVVTIDPEPIDAFSP